MDKTNSKKNSRYVLLVLALILALIAVCLLRQGTDEQAEISKYDNHQTILASFIKQEMINAAGGIRTNYQESKEELAFATGADVLSESQGLLMLYAGLEEDKELFEQSLSFVEEVLLSGKLISYRYAENSGRYSVNAAIDDLRIIRALLAASEIFDEKQYQQTAQIFARNLYTINVQDERLLDFYDERYEQAGNMLTLCYADLLTMQQLAEQDPKWEDVLTHSLSLVQGGYLGDDFPLFATYYDYASESYSAVDIETSQALITAINLAEMGLCPKATIDYIKEAAVSGHLYGRYSSGGAAVGNVQSTAVYALAAILGHTVGDAQLVEAALKQMTLLQIKEESHVLYGAFADENSLAAYSFDNLYALLAYAICSE